MHSDYLSVFTFIRFLFSVPIFIKSFSVPSGNLHQALVFARYVKFCGSCSRSRYCSNHYCHTDTGSSCTDVYRQTSHSV